jgi:hypothetical protein
LEVFGYENEQFKGAKSSRIAGEKMHGLNLIEKAFSPCLWITSASGARIMPCACTWSSHKHARGQMQI